MAWPPRSLRWFGIILALGAAACDSTLPDASYRHDFAVSDCSWTPTGRNRYFILEPGYRIVLQGDDTRLEITVLDETVAVDGVTTRVVEERESKAGRLVEVSRNFYAVCEPTKDVYYFGEEVDDYRDGTVVGHGGAWRAGRNGARAGLMMPGAPKAGMKYYQEIAPGVAMDRARIVSVSETCTTPAGTFADCVKMREVGSYDFWTSLMFWAAESKLHAPGIGIVQDENLVLTEHGFVQKGT